MIHPATELRIAGPEIGYGVFATAAIPRGTILWVQCRLDIVFTPAQVAELPAPYVPIIDRYAYADAEGNQILCWDAGRYLNHSCDPTMIAVGREFEVAVRDIAAGDELTCDYGGLNLAAPLQCRCGAPACRGVIDGDDVLRRWRELDQAAAAALSGARGVDQPLLAYARDPRRFLDLVEGRAMLPSHRSYRASALATTP